MGYWTVKQMNKVSFSLKVYINQTEKRTDDKILYWKIKVTNCPFKLKPYIDSFVRPNVNIIIWQNIHFPADLLLIAHLLYDQGISVRLTFIIMFSPCSSHVLKMYLTNWTYILLKHYLSFVLLLLYLWTKLFLLEGQTL